jgi:DNA-binding CsgD family transcriptional regulator
MPPLRLCVPTSNLKETFEAIVMGKTPAMTEATMMTPTAQDGFVCDQMEIYRTPRDRAPFYRDFIRPRGLAYQASAYLDGTGREVVNLMVFRGPRTSGFEPADLRAFSTVLPYVRAAAMASRARLALHADRRAAAFRERGDPVVSIASDGTVRDGAQASLEALAPVVGLNGRRLKVSTSGDQKRLDRALTFALSERKPGLVTIVTEEAHSLRLLVLPIVGQALELFHATAALVVALDITRPPRVDERSLDLLVSATGLTRRETEITRLIAGGCTPRKAAVLLGISYETVRLHLKGACSKLGVHSQAELTSLVNRVSVY